ncbi:hypothetical protein [Delftia tsuruhatensis]|uniref:hypothetical protein n=1 Tax=Delftia tsuruhatensis TaxID=180282 RepID=UPI001F16FCD8|nr:hypothetical protein [Delftia tsuruhatensis]
MLSADSTNAFTPSSDIYSGISVLGSGGGIELTTFFETAVTDNPTSTQLIHAMLGMQKQDEFRLEFSEAMALRPQVTGRASSTSTTGSCRRPSCRMRTASRALPSCGLPPAVPLASTGV